jgi:hypothetical protein
MIDDMRMRELSDRTQRHGIRAVRQFADFIERSPDTASVEDPAPIAELAYQNKAVIYGLMSDVAAETLLTIAADPKHLGAKIGAALVLHTWGSAHTYHAYVHGIVSGGGLSPWAVALLR